MLAPGFWDDQRVARRLAREAEGLREELTLWKDLTTAARDLGELFELAESEGDQGLQDEVASKAALLEGDFEKARTSLLFSGEYADADAIVTIQAGAGGTEACDWASMLLRQYLRYAERKGFKSELLEESEGDVAGIKSATIKISGDYAFGFLRTETGVHRLVRKSPFDSSGGRHTSFASVFVYPEVDDSIEIEINPADVRTDTFRASGAGGQHINKTDSAVRITHLPTGIVAECQDDRSQHRNKAKALQVLSARIQEKERSERAAKDAALRKGLIGSGDRSDRIRTYNFPQGRLTDHRIGLTLYKLGLIMEGQLGEVISALQVARGAEQLAELEAAAP